MNDEIEAVTETAKAVKEGAKMGRAVVEAGSDLGRYVAKVIGTVPEDAVGLAFGDALKAKRWANAEKVFREAFSKMEARGVENLKEIDLKQIQPLLEAVSEESDETLQDMWADLLANAMDPNKDVHLQKVLINTLRQFEPVDAMILQALAGTKPKTQLTNVGNVAKGTNLRGGLVIISCTRLHEIGCLILNTDNPESIFETSFAISALGEELLLACGAD